MRTLDQRIACVKREIDRREKIYPRLVESGKLTEDESVSELSTMKDVYETLTQLRGILT